MVFSRSISIPPLGGGESVFLHLRVGLSPSKRLENAREGVRPARNEPVPRSPLPLSSPRPLSPRDRLSRSLQDGERRGQAVRPAVPPKHRRFARAMRADATKAENLLWQALRAKQLEGLKFRRQVPLDGYILDFVCFEASLIVEVDGGQHSQSADDAVRRQAFRAPGISHAPGLERRGDEKPRRRVPDNSA